MALLKNNRFIKDSWQEVSAGSSIPAAPVLVHLTDWQERREVLRSHPYPTGVILPNDVDATSIAPDLKDLDLVILEFPSFTDGRAYSQARHLRERLGFGGEIRARGEILRDQITFMLRCGVDAFEINDPASLASWQKNQSRFTHWYQPAADRQAGISGLRHQAVAAE